MWNYGSAIIAGGMVGGGVVWFARDLAIWIVECLGK